MTPPFTGFFMNIVGLGKVHKGIERQKREAGRGGKSGTRPPDWTRKVDQIGQPYKTWSSSRPIRDSRRISNGPPPSSREITRTRDGPPPFTRVHWKDLSRDTLAAHDLAWHWDKNDKDYIIIEKHLTRHELNELLQHTGRLRERNELNIAVREAENDVEQIKSLRESKERSDAGRESERRRECGTGRASTRGNRNHDGGHAHVPQPGLHTHVNQTQNNQPEAPQKASTPKWKPNSPSPSEHSSQISAAPSMHSRLTHPWSPHSYTSMEQPHQSLRQTHRSQSRSRTSQAPAELPAMSSRRARESYETTPGRPTVQRGSGSYERVPNTKTASRQWRHMPAPSEHVHFASPPESESLAREARLEQAAENVRRAYTHAPGSRLEDAQGTGTYQRDTRQIS